MLESLGFEPRVELVYRALLGRPDTTAACSPRPLDRPVAGVEAALGTLVGRGSGAPLAATRPTS